MSPPTLKFIEFWIQNEFNDFRYHFQESLYEFERWVSKRVHIYIAFVSAVTVSQYKICPTFHNRFVHEFSVSTSTRHPSHPSQPSGHFACSHNFLPRAPEEAPAQFEIWPGGSRNHAAAYALLAGRLVVARTGKIPCSESWMLPPGSKNYASAGHRSHANA